MSLDLDSANRLIEIGIALSSEKDINVLMEKILLEAMDLTNADGGTLYVHDEASSLRFEIIRTRSLDIAQGGTSDNEVSLPPVQLTDEEGNPNLKNIVTFAAIKGETVNIEDAYVSKDFDFSGPKKFDDLTGFRSQSFLTVPMKNKGGDLIGVLQLLNCMEPGSQRVIAFGQDIQPMVESLASQAAVSLDNAQLMKEMADLQQAFIELLASALDAKSPYTGGHCQRVPELAKMLTEAASEEQAAPFTEFSLNEDDRNELHLASWMHDCGKVVTPEYVVDKATKLETITDRIHEIRTRFEVIKRDARIRCLEAILQGNDAAQEQVLLEAELQKIDNDFYFIAETNLGGEFLEEGSIDRVKQIGDRTWSRTLDNRAGVSIAERKRFDKIPEQSLPVEESLIADRPDHLIEHSTVPSSADPENRFGFKVNVPEHRFNLGEIYNLSISRGTLTDEERFIINDHIVQTIVMLEKLPLPKSLQRVPEIAGGHHEKIDGTGYPRGLVGSQMSLPARVMAIADIFEALTAADRPYKGRKNLSQCLKIMSFMAKDNHIDTDLYRLFLEKGIYLEYAQRFLLADQIDDIDIQDFMVA
jgi:HD-GYP domain-containing protein (c-di-GMP phosphodiesterase class II)